MPSTVRVVESVAVQDPEVEGSMVTLVKDKPYPSDHPLVAAYSWAFAPDQIEEATASPGAKRNVKR